MKAKILILLGVLASYGFISNEGFRKKNWTLQELLKSDKAQIKATCIYEDRKNTKITLKSDFSYPIKLTIPAGTLLYPENDKQQTLAIPKERLITLKPKSSRNLVLRGFCTEKSESSPTQKKDFTIGFSKNEKLNKFFSYLDTSKNLSESNMQEAIWCITDNQSIGYIYEPKNTNLKKVLSEITGQKIPWQSTKRRIMMESGRQVVTIPQLVSGRIVFSTTKPETILSKIIDEEGEMVYQFEKPAKVPKANNIRLKFNVRVKGYNEGKYYVIYYTESGEELVKKEFTV